MENPCSKTWLSVQCPDRKIGCCAHSQLSFWCSYLSELWLKLVFLSEVTFSIHCQNSISLAWFTTNTISFMKPSSRSMAS